jgi:hypothetical protein
MSFQSTRVTREDLVESSVFAFIKAGLEARGFPDGQIEYLEAFQTTLFEGEVTKSYVAAGFHMNDGGMLFELGSTLRKKVYTFEYWIIGLNYAQGKNLAHAVSEIVEGALIIPLLDFTQPGHPVIAALESAEHPAKVERSVVGNPMPWQQHLYCAHVPVLDYYYPPTPLVGEN